MKTNIDTAITPSTRQTISVMEVQRILKIAELIVPILTPAEISNLNALLSQDSLTKKTGNTSVS